MILLVSFSLYCASANRPHYIAASLVMTYTVLFKVGDYGLKIHKSTFIFSIHFKRRFFFSANEEIIR